MSWSGQSTGNKCCPEEVMTRLRSGGWVPLVLWGWGCTSRSWRQKNTEEHLRDGREPGTQVELNDGRQCGKAEWIHSKKWYQMSTERSWNQTMGGVGGVGSLSVEEFGSLSRERRKVTEVYFIDGVVPRPDEPLRKPLCWSVMLGAPSLGHRISW